MAGVDEDYRGDGHADEGDGADEGSGHCTGKGFAKDRRTRSDIFSDQRRHRKIPWAAAKVLPNAQRPLLAVFDT